MNTDDQSVLLIHHRDITSPIGSTTPYYLANKLAESHNTHVLCPKWSKERNGNFDDSSAVFHDIPTGEVPILSPLLFLLFSTIYGPYLTVVNQFDVIYTYQSSIIQGWISARLGRSRLVIGLGSVPVRQNRDFIDSNASTRSIRERVSMWFRAQYASLVGPMLEQSFAVVALTDNILEVTKQEYDISLPHAHVIPMGVDFAEFSNNDPAHRDSSNDQWVITYIGSVTPNRDLEQVLIAMASIEHDIKFKIAGKSQDTYLNSFFETAQSLDVRHQVEWLGLLPHSEIPALMAETDIAISPLPDIESYRISFPAKLLEYMASGTVIIASDIPPHRRLIQDGETGYLYDTTTEGLVSAFERCFSDRENHAHIREQAIAISAAYDWEKIIAQHEAVIFDN